MVVIKSFNSSGSGVIAPDGSFQVLAMSSSISKSYNALTGVLNITGTSNSIDVDKWMTDGSYCKSVVSINYDVYMIAD